MSSSPETKTTFIMSEESADQIAKVLTEEILHKTRIQDYIMYTVDNRTGVPTDFMVNDDGVYSTHVMVRRGEPIDVPPGTWRQLDYDTEDKFEFARFMLRKQLEQWGVVFQSDHLTLAEAEGKERTRIKSGHDSHGLHPDELFHALTEDKLYAAGLSPEFLKEPHDHT